MNNKEIEDYISQNYIDGWRYKTLRAAILASFKGPAAYKNKMFSYGKNIITFTSRPDEQ